MLISLSVATPQLAPQEPARDLRRAARSAAFRYESLLRRRAPFTHGAGRGVDCDEIIGRFCFTFGDDGMPDPPPEPEHPDIDEARRVAVRAHRRWLSADPADSEAAGALIRYLISGGRADEAVSLARTHVWAADRSPPSLLLLGLALHHAGAFEGAELAFDSARSAVGAEERERWDDIRVLLEPRERSRYGRLTAEQRRAYHRRFWALSDPSLLEPGNERRSAHYARHAWIQILSRAPSAQGMLHWGRDHEEILLRYGLPTSRERIRQPAWRLHTELRMVETFDPHAVTFMPFGPDGGVPETPPPGVRPALERDTVRASYAPIRHHRTRGLELQVARFPALRGSLLRVSGVLRPDTVDPAVPASPRGLVAVLDTLGNEVVRAEARVRVRPDSFTAVSGDVAVPPGAYVYRLELTDDSTGLAGLAQHRLTIEAVAGLTLADLAVAHPAADPESAEGRPPLAPTLVLAPGQVVLVYTEVSGLHRTGARSRYAVEWWLEPLDRGSLLGRAARWLGRTLGVVAEAEPVRVRWEDGSEQGDPVPIAFTLD
ncbi:MAG: hypothetical protein GWN71_19670, partial [Gammaproteobacteria bacterium]|nr:hypothetical protein [Gammaproteobacteria bacterium]